VSASVLASTARTFDLATVAISLHLRRTGGRQETFGAGIREDRHD
jgi:hypothetical protein